MRLFVWWVMGFAVGYALGLSIGTAHGADPLEMPASQDFPRDDTLNFVKWTPVREYKDWGFGPIINDLEQYALNEAFARKMRNKKDPGNWVHEMTHYVNATMRIEASKLKKRKYNSFYVLNGYAVSLPEPNITIKQVAELIPEEVRGKDYDDYLVDARKWRNRQPLFLMDEAVAATNTLLYQVSVNQPDDHRYNLVRQWEIYGRYLVEAVEKHDPDYDNLPQLKAFVIWHGKRCRHLMRIHRQLTDPQTYDLF